MALRILKAGRPGSTETPATPDQNIDTPPDADTPQASPAAPPPGARRFILPAIGGLAALAALWAGTDWLLTGRYEISTDYANVRANITTVAAKVQGYVESIHVVDNQTVKAGDLLLTIEANDYRARLAEAEAALLQANAQVAARAAAVDAALGRSASQRDLLAEARAAAEAADATADLSASDAKRFAELAEQGWYPRARAESAATQERAARAQSSQAAAGVTASRSQLATSQSAVLQARQELAAAEAAVAAAQARVETAQLDLGRTQIRAPVDGVIANRTVSTGQLLSPGQIALAVVPVADAYVIANFKETQIAKMRPGQPVAIHIDAYPDMKLTGRIDSLAPATGSTFSLMPQDTATGNFTKIVQRVPVRIALDEEALATGLLRAGLAVEATVSVKPQADKD